MNNFLFKKNQKITLNGLLGQTEFDLAKIDSDGLYAIQIKENKIPVLLNLRKKLTGNKKQIHCQINTNQQRQNFLADPEQTKKEKSPKKKKETNSIVSFFKQKVKAVSHGFFIYLRVVGVGYRIFMYDKTLSFKLGFSHFYKVKIPENIKAFLPEPTLLCLYGVDKNQVTQIAAQIQQLKKPSPYKGKGIRLLNSPIRLKPGKRK